MSDFEKFFSNGGLQTALKQDRTLVKEECECLFEHIKKIKPKVIVEIGTKYGCSTSFFVEVAKWNFDCLF